MEKQILFRFLILCISLSEVFASLENNESADSLEHLMRKKRVLDSTPNANTRVHFRDFSYVVNVKKNGNHICAGSILSAHVILTPAVKVQDHARYSVVAGTKSTRGGGTLHIVNGILRHPQYQEPSFHYNVALLSLDHPITFGSRLNQPISIYNSNNGQLPPNTLVTVSGFGLIYEEPRFPGIRCISNPRGREERVTFPSELRAIQVPTISIQACRAHHLNDARHIVDNEIICTHHQQKSCSPNEYGNPLVYQGHLVGILVWDGYLERADIFVNVAFTSMRNWIMANMFPERIPRYYPPPPSPPVHHHRRPESCSLVHPCND